MKALPWIIVGILVLIVAYMYMNKPVVIATTVNSTQPTNNIYAAGLALANLIGSTKCGKNGNPPCTPKDLADAGWSQEQIAAAAQGANTVQNTYLCANFGINCP